MRATNEMTGGLRRGERQMRLYLRNCHRRGSSCETSDPASRCVAGFHFQRIGRRVGQRRSQDSAKALERARLLSDRARAGRLGLGLASTEQQPVEGDVLLHSQGNQKIGVRRSAVLVTIDVLLEDSQLASERALRAISANSRKPLGNLALVPFDYRTGHPTVAGGPTGCRIASRRARSRPTGSGGSLGRLPDAHVLPSINSAQRSGAEARLTGGIPDELRSSCSASHGRTSNDQVGGTGNTRHRAMSSREPGSYGMARDASSRLPSQCNDAAHSTPTLRTVSQSHASD